VNFWSIYQHGFARVAACTGHTVIADPRANAASILRLARGCSEEGVAIAVFPELGLTGYSIEDLLLQDVVLDDVEAALAEIVAASADLLPVLVLGAPLRHRHRIYNCAVVVHRGRILGIVPKSYPPNYREFYERRQIASGEDERGGTIQVAGRAVPFGVDLLFAAEDVPGLVLHAEICEDMWVPVPPSAQAALAGRRCWSTSRAARSPWAAPRTAGCCAARPPRAAWRRTSTPRRAWASRAPTCPGTARP